MKSLLILYATKEGHTLRVAGHLASTLGGLGHAVECVCLGDLKWTLDWTRYAGCILAASVHGGTHEPSMTWFVRQHREQLQSLPTAFVSSSLSEAIVEDTAQSSEQRATASKLVRDTLETFFEQTGWHPDHELPVAGALLYTQYGRVLRFVMKTIAKRVGLSTDTEHDHRFTDWAELERFAATFSRELHARSPMTAGPAAP